MASFIMTVSQINRYLKSVIESDDRLAMLYVRGEISGFSRNHQSGHCYFSLKDESSVIRAVMFQSYAARLRFQPTDAMRVIVAARVTVYERGGSYQLQVTDMQPDGVGAMHLAYEQLRAKLEGEGLFDPAHKRPIPRYPRKIAVITSRTGAAVHDILSILERRWPLGEILFYPVAVQGETAAAGMIAALADINRRGEADVILLGRGGGSAEDLWCFNDEALARAIHRSEIPVITAIGHETDYTIADFVADLRAPTPSAAAELAAAGVEDTLARLESAGLRMQGALTRKMALYERLIRDAQNRRGLRDPYAVYRMKARRVYQLEKQLQAGLGYWIDLLDVHVQKRAALLEALSPLRVLARGYALVTDQTGNVLHRTADAQPGDSVRIRLTDGTLTATITGEVTDHDQEKNEF